MKFSWGDRCNATLGGARSILVSYGGMLTQFRAYIFYPKNVSVSRKSGTFFDANHIYCYVAFLKEETDMFETTDPQADLEDLIFYPGDGGPSER